MTRERIYQQVPSRLCFELIFKEEERDERIRGQKLQFYAESLRRKLPLSSFRCEGLQRVRLSALAREL